MGLNIRLFIEADSSQDLETWQELLSNLERNGHTGSVYDALDAKYRDIREEWDLGRLSERSKEVFGILQSKTPYRVVDTSHLYHFGKNDQTSFLCGKEVPYGGSLLSYYGPLLQTPVVGGVFCSACVSHLPSPHRVLIKALYEDSAWRPSYR